MKKSTASMVAGVLAASLIGGCAATQEDTGTLIGAAGGAAAGSAIGSGSGRVAAIILGALAGGAIGRNVGRHMDEQDRIQTAQAMEYTPTGERRTWRNPDTNYEYGVTPTRTYQTAQGPCREFTMDGYVDGRPQQVNGTACRQPDGTWRVLN